MADFHLFMGRGVVTIPSRPFGDVVRPYFGGKVFVEEVPWTYRGRGEGDARLYPQHHPREGIRRILHLSVASSFPNRFVPLMTLYVAHILAPGAFARMPLVDRVAALKIPVTFACEFPPFFLDRLSSFSDHLA